MPILSYTSAALRGIWKTLNHTPLAPKLYRTIRELNISQVKPTKRGCRGGLISKLQKPRPIDVIISTRQSYSRPSQLNTTTRGVNINNLIQIKPVRENTPKPSNQLPNVLLTNCRSLNTTKSDELKIELKNQNSALNRNVADGKKKQP